MDELFLAEFSHESILAAKCEILALEKAGGSFSIIELNDDFALIEGTPDQVEEAAFVNCLSRVLQTEDRWEGFHEIQEKGSFYLRVKDFHGCHNSSEEPAIGRLVKGSNKVVFKNPDFRLRALHADRWYLAKVIHQRDRSGMESRRAPLRPFFSPVALHPKYARFLVNSTETVHGDVILDPFCGTGGIILEAALMGRRVVGNDISLNMVKGARLNLKYFNVKEFRVSNHDVKDLALDSTIDGIATDLPYGRNSNMSAESIHSLYKSAFLRFHEWLAPGRICSVIVSDRELLKYSGDLFQVESIVPVPQHRSLTRYFVAMRRL